MRHKKQKSLLLKMKKKDLPISLTEGVMILLVVFKMEKFPLGKCCIYRYSWEQKNLNKYIENSKCAWKWNSLFWWEHMVLMGRVWIRLKKYYGTNFLYNFEYHTKKILTHFQCPLKAIKKCEAIGIKGIFQEDDCQD